MKKSTKNIAEEVFMGGQKSPFAPFITISILSVVSHHDHQQWANISTGGGVVKSRVISNKTDNLISNREKVQPKRLLFWFSPLPDTFNHFPIFLFSARFNLTWFIDFQYSFILCSCNFQVIFFRPYRLEFFDLLVCLFVFCLFVCLFLF